MMKLKLAGCVALVAGVVALAGHEGGPRVMEEVRMGDLLGSAAPPPPPKYTCNGGTTEEEECPLDSKGDYHCGFNYDTLLDPIRGEVWDKLYKTNKRECRSKLPGCAKHKMRQSVRLDKNRSCKEFVPKPVK